MMMAVHGDTKERFSSYSQITFSSYSSSRIWNERGVEGKARRHCKEADA